MDVLLFNGSPRENGNTAHLLTRMADVFSEKNARTEFIQLGGKPVQGCTACMECRKNKDERCVIDDDEGYRIVTRLAENILWLHNKISQ
ncbi:MAG: flavodoxin family protein [Bacteroidota bacterium]